MFLNISQILSANLNSTIFYLIISSKIGGTELRKAYPTNLGDTEWNKIETRVCQILCVSMISELIHLSSRFT